MVEWLFRKSRQHFILVMMLLTRLFCLVGGALVVYYVDLTITMAPEMWERFRIVAAFVIVISTLMTVLLSLWETRTLRSVLRDLEQDRPVDDVRARAAGAEAVQFAGRHHRRESILVPATTVLPL